VSVDPVRLAFRPLTTEDLPLLYCWLNEPHVAQWYREEAGRPFAEIVQRYHPARRAHEGMQQFVVMYNGQPIGQIQTYRVSDAAEYGGAAFVDPGAAAVDLLIGDPAYVHQGLGAPLLRRFVQEVVFGVLGATCCLIDPEQENSAAIRCYLKAGFRPITTFRRNATRTEMMLLRLDRADSQPGA
jgi:RimJ/RimL family protein N-acetyltransferase